MQINTSKIPLAGCHDKTHFLLSRILEQCRRTPVIYQLTVDQKRSYKNGKSYKAFHWEASIMNQQMSTMQGVCLEGTHTVRTFFHVRTMVLVFPQSHPSHQFSHPIFSEIPKMHANHSQRQILWSQSVANADIYHQNLQKSHAARSSQIDI